MTDIELMTTDRNARKANDSANAAIDHMVIVWRSFQSPTDAEVAMAACIFATRATVHAALAAAASADTAAETAWSAYRAAFKRLASDFHAADCVDDAVSAYRAACAALRASPLVDDMGRAAQDAEMRASDARNSAKLAAEWANWAERAELADFMRGHEYHKRVVQLAAAAAAAATSAANLADAAADRAARADAV